MKLKESTFAIIAEKKDSISHKWFNENTKLLNERGVVFWVHTKEHYIYSSGKYIGCFKESPTNIPIYTEIEFEALLKAEQENEATQTFGGKSSTGENAQTFPAKGDGNIILEGFEQKQITISYNLALEYIAERLNVDKGIIKIEMP